MKQLLIYSPLLYVSALFLGLSGCASAQSGSSTKPQASHNIEQFKEILSGKVWVSSVPAWKEDNNIPSVMYLAKDGTYFECEFGISEKGQALSHEARQGNPKWNNWNLTKPFMSSGLLFVSHGNRVRTIPVYDEKNNILERWYKLRNGWSRTEVGHLQDNWPFWALFKCPSLKLPADLKFNFDQKDPDYKQNYAVHELTRAASKVVPVTEDEARAYLFGNNGNILVDSDGQTYVMNGYHSEFWKVNDKLDITDIAQAKILEDRMTIQWSGKNEPQVYRFGDQVQLKPTGKRHPAFAFSDWLQQQDIVKLILPEKLALNFLNHKTVKIHKPDRTQEAQGSWWFEGDQLTLSFTLTEDGNTPTIRAIPWQEAARQLGYPLGNTVTE